MPRYLTDSAKNCTVFKYTTLSSAIANSRRQSILYPYRQSIFEEFSKRGATESQFSGASDMLLMQHADALLAYHLDRESFCTVVIKTVHENFPLLVELP